MKDVVIVTMFLTALFVNQRRVELKGGSEGGDGFDVSQTIDS